MTERQLLLCLPMLGLLLAAAAIDLRWRRIPNWLSLALVAAGLTQSFLPGYGLSPLGALSGLGVGFGLTFILFAIGALGGGDVKLLAGVGAWMGPRIVLSVFLGAAVAGLVMVLILACSQGRLKTLFRNSAVLTLSFAHAGEVGMQTTVECGKSCRSVDRPLPYAVPVLVATLAVLSVAWHLGS